MKTVEQMLAELEVAVEECIIIPNEWLPTEYQDQIRGGRTIARLNELSEVLECTHSQHVKVKAIKARNIEKMRKQVEEKSLFAAHGDFIDLDGELDYSDNEADEIQHHKNMMALVGGMINSGMIDAEDLEEE
jgi:hypothetical protein